MPRAAPASRAKKPTPERLEAQALHTDPRIPRRARPRSHQDRWIMNKRGTMKWKASGNRRLRPAPAQLEFPDQRLGRLAGDPQNVERALIHLFQADSQASIRGRARYAS